MVQAGVRWGRRRERGGEQAKIRPVNFTFRFVLLHKKTMDGGSYLGCVGSGTRHLSLRLIITLRENNQGWRCGGIDRGEAVALFHTGPGERQTFFIS